MEVIRGLEACPRPESGTALTIGAYDGVHRGHRAVIKEVRRLAGERELKSAVVTFDPHPARVVRPESAPLMLTNLDQKLELLDETGIDFVLVVPFDDARSQEPPRQFVEQVLVECMHARVVVVGDDFHFGHRRTGNVPYLTEAGGELGFDVTGMLLVGLDGEAARDHDQVSSTAIRRALVAGDIDTATEMLGRPFELRGTVVKGDERAKQMGFPTANVAIPTDMLLPADGVYAGWYERPDNSVHPTVMNLGRRPTFYEETSHSTLECHLLGFQGDLYDEAARVRFTDRLRSEAKFDGIDELKSQIAKDSETAKKALGVS